MTETLRIGVIVDQPVIDGWQRLIVGKLLADPRFEVDTLILHKAAGTPAAAGTAVWKLADRFEHNTSARLFRRLFKNRHKQEEGSIDLARSCAQVLQHHSGNLNGAPTGEQAEKSLTAALLERRLDVIINLGSNHVSQAVGEAARLGVWEIWLNGRFAGHNSAPGFWEVYRNEPITEISVRRQSGNETPSSIIRQGHYRTFLWSWNENIRQLNIKSAWLLYDALNQLVMAGGSFAVTELPGEEAQPGDKLHRRVNQLPGALRTITGLVKCYARVFREMAFRMLGEEKWRLFVYHGALDINGGAPGRSATSALTPIIPSSRGYWADPFIMAREGKHYLFFEEYLYKEKKGVISVVALDDPDDFSKLNGRDPQIIINEPYHMSYPFLIEADGALYMIPESNADECIGLWKCTRFPDQWQKQKNIMQGLSATDTSLLHHHDKWWMFTNIDRSGLKDHCTELCIFHSDDPINGSWTPHPKNPVVTDARCARMAGGFVKTGDGALIRCGQVNERHYGEALALREIVVLSETDYEEKHWQHIAPDWYPGIYRNHHLVQNDGLTVVDACHNQLKLRRFLGK